MGSQWSGLQLRTPRYRALRLEGLERRDLLAVELVSANIFGGSGNSSSDQQQISDNGRFVVFESNATDLVAGDVNQPSIVDIFRRDLVTGQTLLVSVAATAGGANNTSRNPQVSADGRYVVFESFATNLVAVNDVNGSGSDLFLRDVVAGTTTLITRSVSGVGTANLPSTSPSISNDGRFVAYESQAGDLVTVGLDNNIPFRDVYVWDRLTLQNTLISTQVGTANSGNRESFGAQISDDGFWVAFLSDASNLVANDVNGPVVDVFAKPTVGGATTLISANVNNVSGNNSSSEHSISDDGRFITFVSNANDLVPGFIDNNSLPDIYLRDRVAGTTSLVSIATTGLSGNSTSSEPMVSGNGRFVTFLSAATNLIPSDLNAAQDVFVRDTFANTTILVSAPISGAFGANNNSFTPVISDDGRYVAFSSTASNLVANDINLGIFDVFRRDVALGVTVLVSVNAAGTGSGNSSSLEPVINGSGLAVAFVSTASDLVINDTNQFVPDIFAFASSDQILVTGADAGGGPHVRVLDARNLTERYGFFPFNTGFRGGVRVATGDVNFDGVPDIITAAGPGGGPHIRVFNGAVPTQQLAGPLGSFFAYTPGFAGGVYVAAADIDRDGRADIITGADSSGGPHVRVFSGATGGLLFDFFAFGGTFTGGVRVGAGDVDGDGFRDIIVATGPGTGSLVRVFSGTNGAIIREISPYGAFPGGVYISAGDANLDGRADIITGAGAGGGPHVRVFSGLNNGEIVGFFAYPANFAGGVRVASVDTNGDGRVEIITGTGPGVLTNVRVFSATGLPLTQTTPYPGFGGGVFAAGSVPGLVGGSPITRPAGDDFNVLPSAPNAFHSNPVSSSELYRHAVLAGEDQNFADEPWIESLLPARLRLIELEMNDAVLAELL